MLNKKLVIYILVTFIAFHTYLYIRQRIEWMGEDNAHLTAKEYFVAGQMVHAPLAIACRFIHPENVTLKPYFFLQEKVFNEGLKYLPDKDGEKAIWKQKWFLHLYHRNNHLTKDRSSVNYSPNMVQLLDDTWFCMLHMATLPFADKQMKYEQYYRNFPSVATFYTLNKSQYLAYSIGSARVMAKEPFFVDRTKQIVSWLQELEDKWNETDYTRQLIDKHPVIRVLQQGAIMGNVHLLIQKDILEGSFSCDNKNTLLYIKTRNAFAGKDAPLFKMIPRKAREHKEGYIDSTKGLFYRRILKQYCNKDVAGIERPAIGQSHDDEVRFLFRDEYKILDEQFKVNNLGAE